MPKVIYEFYYTVGHYDFGNCYKLVVNKETKKMFYGDAFYLSGTPTNQNFAINKQNLNEIHRIIDKHHGLVYRVHIENCDHKEAEKQARKIIYDYMIDFIEGFKNCGEENEL